MPGDYPVGLRPLPGIWVNGGVSVGFVDLGNDSCNNERVMPVFDAFVKDKA